MKQHDTVSLTREIVEILNVNTYFENRENRENFLSSLEQCYQNPIDIFNRVLSVNNTIFIAKDKSGIKRYLFYNDEENEESLQSTKQIYNGFALINSAYRQTGALKDFYYLPQIF